MRVNITIKLPPKSYLIDELEKIEGQPLSQRRRCNYSSLCNAMDDKSYTHRNITFAILMNNLTISDLSLGAFLLRTSVMTHSLTSLDHLIILNTLGAISSLCAFIQA